MTSAALTEDEVGILLSSAATAPSMHNTQPWRFEVSGCVVDVILDEERMLPAEDPAGRMILIGLGAATFNLRVAAAMLGHDTTLATNPDPDRPEITARVFLGERQSPVPSLASLYGELRRRHTYRGAMQSLDVPPRVLMLLSSAAQIEGADLDWLAPDPVRKLTAILAAADELDLHDEDRLIERGRWVGGDRTADGVPARALGPVSARPAAFRDLGAGFDDEHRSTGVFELTPRIGVLTTDEDRPSQWLRAGMALQRALLTATSYGLVASFLNQALEYVDLRAHVRELVCPAARPQTIIRLGYPTHTGSDTPRRPWRQTLQSWE
jgi:nitroreductase